MKSILLIGLGRFGRHLGQKFIEEGNEVLAIEKNESLADRAVDVIPNIQICDATDEHYMESLGISNFDLCIVAIGDNFQNSLEITVLLKDLGARFVIARASSDVHEKLLLRNGADYVVYAEKEMAERLAVKFGSKNIFDYIELTRDYAIYEIAVPASWCGKSIVENSIRNKYHISILATKKNGRIYPLPTPDHVLNSEETLMVMGGADSIRKLTK